MHPIFLNETIDALRSVLLDAAGEIASDPDVKGSIALTREDGFSVMPDQ
jgi:hypothetical protein